MTLKYLLNILNTNLDLHLLTDPRTLMKTLAIITISEFRKWSITWIRKYNSGSFF